MRAVCTTLVATLIAGAAAAQTPATKAPTKSQPPATKPASPTGTKAQPPVTKAAPPGATKGAPPVATNGAPPASKNSQPASKTPAQPATKGVTQAGAKGPPGQGAAGRPGLTVASGDTMTPPPSILREVFEYRRNGRRDPFVSLLSTNDLRPTLDELTLLGILYDPAGGSVAMLHDTGNKRYAVRVGSILGRMHVTAIRAKAVIFTIEEFGANRQDSLFLNDSTRTRRP